MIGRAKESDSLAKGKQQIVSVIGEEMAEKGLTRLETVKQSILGSSHAFSLGQTRITVPHLPILPILHFPIKSAGPLKA